MFNAIRVTGKPVTHERTPVADLVGRVVAVRPHYYLPARHGCLVKVRAPWTVPVRVTGVSGAGLVRVKHLGPHEAPWAREQIYAVAKLHATRGDAVPCECAACIGDGIHGLRGA